ncbi:MAG: ComGF family competence protein [Clostridium sp.]|uniref:competence type IV pilus minor pilin ComGF n=1 Tax=Clostridium sp. TaxID=1506 RepID=UPI0025B964B1|nr:competence type IV pilus minor pilin ComGF [Clostridium sp.]MCE5221419.1 ComGF family competence protein [Clostridium sp.]
MNLPRVGGWMKYKNYVTSKKKRGFTIIESLVYIFLTTIILVEGINLYVLMYKSYMEAVNLTIEYNDFQNFYINLDNIMPDIGLENIVVDDKYILFSMDNKSGNSDILIKSYDGNIVAKYTESGPMPHMIQDIDYLEVKKKGKLIYLIIHDKEGKDFIKCI